MPRSLRRELDSLMKAQLEQSDAWHRAMAEPGGTVDTQGVVTILLDWNGILREAILRVAEEIDRLRGTEEPES